MAKKNEILLSIALEGDAEIKSKLKAVGEVGKQSLADIDKKLSAAQKQFDDFGSKGLAGTLGKIREAVAPLTEASGLGGLLGSLGAGGLLGRLGAGLTSPAGLVAGITGALLGMAKLGDETERQKGRLKSLGDAGGFGKLTEQAKQLGTNVSDLQPRYEKFIAAQQKANAENRSLQGPVDESAGNVRVVGGGENNTPPTGKAFQAFDRALFESIRKDVGDADQAHRISGEFEDTLSQNRRLTGDALRSLQRTAPSAANFLTNSLSPSLGRRFANPNELASLLDRGGAQVGASNLVNEAAKHAPEADKQAEAARGVTESFGALEAAAKRLAESFGGDHAGIARAVDAAAKLVDQGAGQTEKFLQGADNLPGGKNFIGPVRSEDDRSKVPASLGEVFFSDKGDLLGRLVGFIRGGASPGGANPFGSITDFIGKALGDPAALQEKVRPAEGPGALPSAAAPPQETPAASAAGQSLLDGISAAINSLNPQNLKVDTPASGLGIRGDIDAVDSGLKEFVVALAEAANNIRGNASPAKAALAGGGMIRRLDDGGHISGPGTSTSDSIPAMLSDGEYVIKADSARKLGRGRLDRLNAFANGGEVDFAKFRRFAAGGSAGDAAGIGSVTALGPGNHEIAYDPDTGGAYVDGVLRRADDPLLQDPLVRQAIEQSKRNKDTSGRRKYKSDFVGLFGGHEFGQSGSYARGGPVIDWPGFADGGLVGEMSYGGAAPQLDENGGAPGGAIGHYTVDLRTNHGEFKVMGDEEVARKLSNAARDSAMVQTGQSPSWVQR